MEPRKKYHLLQPRASCAQLHYKHVADTQLQGDKSLQNLTQKFEQPKLERSTPTA